MLISFSGLDGAGKSTLIAWLRAHLQQRGIPATVRHMNDHIGVYAYARMLRNALRRTVRARPADTATTAQSAAGLAAAGPDVSPTRRSLGRARQMRDALVWNAALRSVLYPLDLLIFLLYRLWFEGIRRQVLIMDRYFYDTLVDLSVRGAARTVRLLQRITPEPALAILLDITPEESFARKHEYSVPYLQRRHVAYHQVLSRVSTILLVRNDDRQATQRVLAEALDTHTAAGGPAVHPGQSRATNRAARATRTQPAAASEGLAAFALRALLDKTASCTPAPEEWPLLRVMAAQNRVLLRLHGWLERADIRVPASFTLAVASEQARARAVVAGIDAVERALRAAGIDVVFPKAFMHFPDVGGDIDLLVGVHDGPAVATVLMDAVGAVPHPIRLRHRVAGSATFAIPACPVSIDVHCGRLGPGGEQLSYAAYLLRHAVTARSNSPNSYRTARPEDQLVLQGQDRVYARRALRLSDFVFTIRLLRDAELDWDHVIATAQRTDALGGLSCYLAYAEQVHQRLLGEQLLPTHVRTALRLSGWGQVSFRAGQIAFPAIRAGALITLEKLTCAVRAHSWDSAARICLLPLITLASSAGRARAAAPPLLARSIVSHNGRVRAAGRRGAR